jgi:pimeloyl-ACP methyl ester carboxylesterase
MHARWRRSRAAPWAPEVREVHLDTPFGRLAGLRSGDGGVPVLALHGWLDNAASFVPLAAHLDGLDVVALDLPGHGASAHLPPSADYTMVSAARAVLSAADALGWSRFALLGHSLGGATATLVAAGAPQRVAKLALIEALGGLVEAENATARRLQDAFAAQAEPAGARRRVFPDVATAVRARLLAGGLGEAAARLIVERGLAPALKGGYVWRSDARLTRPTAVRMTEGQVRDVVAAIECPVRLLHAVPAFRFFPADVRDARAALLRDADVIGLDGGHHLHMDIPGEVAAVLAPFLRG